MAKMRPLYEFPANVPSALIEAYIRVGRNGRKLSKELGVNDYYVSQMFRGVEPTNPDIREKLFLPRSRRKPRTQIQEAILAMSQMARQGLRLWKRGR